MSGVRRGWVTAASLAQGARGLLGTDGSQRSEKEIAPQDLQIPQIYASVEVEIQIRLTRAVKECLRQEGEVDK